MRLAFSDVDLASAVSQLRVRSERQEDVQKLVDSFVDSSGILNQIINNTNQIIYGRRGTGKTHLFRVAETAISRERRQCVAYIDTRVLGSSSQFSDFTIPLPQRCLALFRDLLQELYNQLLDAIVHSGAPQASVALDALDELLSDVSAGRAIPVPDVRTETLQFQEQKAKELGMSLGEKPGITARANVATTSGSQFTSSYKMQADDKVYFPDLTRTLKKILDSADLRMTILIDDWSSLPLDTQPFLAEFVKRSFFSNPKITLKIAALEYRSNFLLEKDSTRIGFELGADISASLDLDDYYVYDRNPEQIAAVYADILLKHLNVDLPEEKRFESIADFKSVMFTQSATLQELGRAAEGVIRDLMNIFSRAYFAARKKQSNSIDKATIIEAAREWFEQDKQQTLSDDLRSVLRRIVDEIIGKKKARSFLLPRELERDPVVQKLFDNRVIHLMRRGYADKNSPGTRYNIYSLDYETYVDLLKTSAAPKLDMQVEPESDEFVVPFDDRRSIRSIVLGEETLRGKAE